MLIILTGLVNWARSFMIVLCVLITMLLNNSVSHADINLELRIDDHFILLHEQVNIGLYAISDDPFENQSFAAMDVIFAWDPYYLELLGNDDTGGPELIYSGFPVPDPFGLNETDPPADGDGLYTAWAMPGNPVDATPEGTLVTSWNFSALHWTLEGTRIDILEDGGNPLGHTVVYDGDIPGKDVTGTLTGINIPIFPNPAVVSMLGGVPAPGAFIILIGALTVIIPRRTRGNDS